jgi:hypothetical protein
VRIRSDRLSVGKINEGEFTDDRQDGPGAALFGFWGELRYV